MFPWKAIQKTFGIMFLKPPAMYIQIVKILPTTIVCAAFAYRSSLLVTVDQSGDAVLKIGRMLLYLAGSSETFAQKLKGYPGTASSSVDPIS